MSLHDLTLSDKKETWFDNRCPQGLADYILDLEELTGPVKTTDDLLDVCGSSRTSLQQCLCDVKQIGTLVTVTGACC